MWALIEWIIDSGYRTRFGHVEVGGIFTLVGSIEDDRNARVFSPLDILYFLFEQFL